MAPSFCGEGAGHGPKVPWGPRDAAGLAQDAPVHHPGLSATSSHPLCPKMLPQSISTCLICFPPCLRSPWHSPGVTGKGSTDARGVLRLPLQPCSPARSHFVNQLPDQLCTFAFSQDPRKRNAPAAGQVLATLCSLSPPTLPGPKTASLKKPPPWSQTTGNLVLGWVLVPCAGSISATLATAVPASEQSGQELTSVFTSPLSPRESLVSNTAAAHTTAALSASEGLF